jgi:hypothetical protein
VSKWSAETWAWLAGAVFLLALIAVGPTIAWYRAGLQQRVYQRQGVEMTQWEVFMGAKPVERYVKQ